MPGEQAPVTVLDEAAGLSLPEQEQLELDAFLGLFDDAAAVAASLEAQANEKADDIILQKALGVFDQASAYYSADNAKLLSVAEGLARRLELMGCDHDHFMQTVSDKLSAHEHAHGSASHGHAAGYAEAQYDSRRHQSRANKAKSTIPSVTLFDLIMQYFRKHMPNK